MKQKHVVRLQVEKQMFFKNMFTSGQLDLVTLQNKAHTNKGKSMCTQHQHNLQYIEYKLT